MRSSRNVSILVASFFLVPSLSACGSGGASYSGDGDGTELTDPEENPERPDSAGDAEANVCVRATSRSAQECPHEAGALELSVECTAADRCRAACTLATPCDAYQTSMCWATCSGQQPSSSASAGSSGSSSAGPSPTQYPQCAGYADVMCKCYPPSGKPNCVSSMRSNCETYFGTCRGRATAYYACALGKIDCNDNTSLDACERAAGAEACK